MNKLCKTKVYRKSAECRNMLLLSFKSYTAKQGHMFHVKQYVPVFIY